MANKHKKEKAPKSRKSVNKTTARIKNNVEVLTTLKNKL